MSIHHPHVPIPQPARAFVFAHLPGISLSICAPSDWTARDVADFAAGAIAGDWRVIDKARLGLGQRTPNACDQASDRLHWFLLAARML